MARSAFRFLLTLCMYAGVCLFLYPYVSGHPSYGLVFLFLGAIVTVSSGLLRCYLVDGDGEAHHRAHIRTP